MSGIAKSRFFGLCYPLLIVLVLFSGWLNQSRFEILCAACATLFWLIQLRLAFLLDKGEAEQKRKGKLIGFLLLLPAIGMMATGALLLFPFAISLPNPATYYAIAAPALMLVCLVLLLLEFWTNPSLVGRLLRLAVAAAMSAPLSLVVAVSLHVADANEAVALGSMSTLVFGGAAFVIAVGMILVSRCEYRSISDSIKMTSSLIKRRRLLFTRAVILKDVFLVAGKTAISILSSSFFMFVNALYSGGMGIARLIAVRMHTQDRGKQIESYRWVGVVISISSICYALYSLRLFFGGKTGVYDMIAALVIALYTFVEFGINIREGIRLRKSKALEAKALRAISFASTLICFVLTQTAILSFAGEGDSSFVNALSGVVFGGLAALIGLCVIVDSFAHERTYAA